MIREHILHVRIETRTRSGFCMCLQRHLVRDIGESYAVGAEPVGIARLRLCMDGQHIVQHRRPRRLVARVLVVEEVTSEYVRARLVNRVRRGLGRAVLLDHRDVAHVAAVGNDLLADTGELEVDTVHRTRPRAARRLQLTRVLKVVLDEVRTSRDVADAIRRRNGLAPARNDILVALLDEFLRVDITRQGVEVIRIAVVTIER